MAIDLGDMPEEVAEKPKGKVGRPRLPPRIVEPLSKPPVVREGPSVHDLVYLPAPEETLAAVPPTPPVELSQLTASDQLSGLVDMSLARLKDVLSWRVPAQPECKADFEQVKVILSAVTQTLSAQLRVDDNRLKKQNADMLPKLLAELKEHERRQVIVDVTAHQVASA